MTFDERIQLLFDRMAEDYRIWRNDDEAVAKFRSQLTYTVGRVYIRLINKKDEDHQHCLGFIAKGNTKRFRPGDMLKADGWKGPATNFVRGNLFEEQFPRWTGI